MRSAKEITPNTPMMVASCGDGPALPACTDRNDHQPPMSVTQDYFEHILYKISAENLGMQPPPRAKILLIIKYLLSKYELNVKT